MLPGRVLLSSEVSSGRESEADGSQQNKTVMRDFAVCGMVALIVLVLFAVREAHMLGVQYLLLYLIVVVAVGMVTMTFALLYLAESIRSS